MKHNSMVSNILYFVHYYRKEDPIVLWFSLGEILAGAILPFAVIYYPKLVLDLLQQGAGIIRVLTVLGSFTLLLMILYGVKGALEGGKYFIYNAQRFNMMGKLFLKSLRLPYHQVESGEAQKAYWKAFEAIDGGDQSASSLMITAVISLVTNLLCFALYVATLGILSHWITLLLLALSLADYALSMRQIRYQETLREARATAYKHFECVRSLLGDETAAKDIRMYNMAPWLRDLKNAAIEERRSLSQKELSKQSLYEKFSLTLSLLRDVLAYAYLLDLASQGQISPGDFVLYIGAVMGFSSFVQRIMKGLADIRQAANSTEYLRVYMEYPEEEERKGACPAASLSMPPKIEFCNVSFSYDSKNKPVLSHFNLTIHAGEKLALVGVNGAGKSTLVKLLCGLYDPDEGQILINGVDRRMFSKEAYHTLYSVVFQETLLLPFTVGENLAMRPAEEVDARRAWEALEKAGVASILHARGADLSTLMLKKVSEQGLELSGGEAQRFLLARALYKDGPVLVLDEPTAALDAIAESQVYEQYQRYSEGKTAVFISHRLASTRFSDRIVLLDQGRIVESGTHEELMVRGGAYAHMYEVQSRYYEEEP